MIEAFCQLRRWLDRHNIPVNNLSVTLKVPSELDRERIVAINASDLVRRGGREYGDCTGMRIYGIAVELEVLDNVLA